MSWALMLTWLSNVAENHVGVSGVLPSPASVPKELHLSSLQENSPGAGGWGPGSP